MTSFSPIFMLHRHKTRHKRHQPTQKHLTHPRRNSNKPIISQKLSSSQHSRPFTSSAPASNEQTVSINANSAPTYINSQQFITQWLTDPQFRQSLRTPSIPAIPPIHPISSPTYHYNTLDTNILMGNDPRVNLLIDNCAALEIIIELLSAETGPIAIDLEFSQPSSTQPFLEVMQLSTEMGFLCAIDWRMIRHQCKFAPPNTSTPLRKIVEVLNTKSVILHGGDYDTKILEYLYYDPLIKLKCCPKVFDTQVMSNILGIQPPTIGLDKLIHQQLGVLIEKAYNLSLSDWSVRPLSHRQIAYALQDVRFLHTLYTKLLGRLKCDSNDIFEYPNLHMFLQSFKNPTVNHDSLNPKYIGTDLVIDYEEFTFKEMQQRSNKISRYQIFLDEVDTMNARQKVPSHHDEVISHFHSINSISSGYDERLSDSYPFDLLSQHTMNQIVLWREIQAKHRAIHPHSIVLDRDILTIVREYTDHLAQHANITSSKPSELSTSSPSTSYTERNPPPQQKTSLILGNISQNTQKHSFFSQVKSALNRDVPFVDANKEVLLWFFNRTIPPQKYLKMIRQHHIFIPFNSALKLAKQHGFTETTNNKLDGESITVYKNLLTYIPDSSFLDIIENLQQKHHQVRASPGINERHNVEDGYYDDGYNDSTDYEEYYENFYQLPDTSYDGAESKNLENTMNLGHAPDYDYDHSQYTSKAMFLRIKRNQNDPLYGSYNRNTSEDIRHNSIRFKKGTPIRLHSIQGDLYNALDAMMIEISSHNNLSPSFVARPQLLKELLVAHYYYQHRAHGDEDAALYQFKKIVGELGLGHGWRYKMFTKHLMALFESKCADVLIPIRQSQRKNKQQKQEQEHEHEHKLKQQQSIKSPNNPHCPNKPASRAIRALVPPHSDA